MSWRKWCIRGLVFAIIGACGSAAMIYQRWTDPAVVREQVIAKLQDMYPGAIVTVVSARLRILGGIVVNDLRMCRRDDPEKTEFFYVPSAILYHDKEKLAGGKITLRKIELNRPHLRIVRERDGKWNLQDILGDRPLSQHLPTVVTHHGTIVIEDRASGYVVQPLEIGDIQISFINDPLKLVTVHGTAKSPMIGSVQVDGFFHRDTKEKELTIKTRGTPLSTVQLQRLPLVCCHPELAKLVIEAVIDVDASIAYRPKQETPLDHSIQIRVAKGKLRHPKLPLPLEDIHARIECNNGQIRVLDFDARSGPTVLRGKASAELPKPEQNFEADLELQHVKVDHELMESMPEKLRNLQQLFQTTGIATLHLNCARREGKWANLANGAASRITLLPEDGQACFTKFPYPVDKLSGSIDWLPQTHTTEVDITAYAHDRPVLIHGIWKGEGLSAQADIDIQATDVPLEPKLIAALSPKFQKLTNSFHPTGILAFKGHMRREPGSLNFHNEFRVYMRDGTVCWDEFPYPLEKVSGELDIYPHRWEFRDGHGHHHGGEILVQGQSMPGDPSRSYTEEEGLTLRIEGKDMALDEDLHKALMPQMARVWENFRPRGRLSFAANVERRPRQPQDMDILVKVNGCAIEPHFFPYAMNELSGQFRYHKNRLEVREAKAKHDDTTLELKLGTVELRPGGGYYTDFPELCVKRLKADDTFVKALPKPLRSFANTLQINTPIDLTTRLVISQASEPGTLPEIGWDGKAQLTKAHVGLGIGWDEVNGTVACSGQHNGLHLQALQGNMLLDKATAFKQPFHDVHGEFHVKAETPEDFVLNIRAPIFGGDVAGQVRVEMTSAMRYFINLTASQIDLAELGQHNMGRRAQTQGKMAARLVLSGQGSSFDTLDGNGSIDVPSGRLYNLPLLLDLLKFLGLRVPDRNHTAFEELKAKFSIHGMRVAVSSLELIGSVVSLTGKGDFKLDGTDLNLNFTPSWGRVEQWLPASVRPISPAISKNLLVIEMRGAVDSNPDHLKFNKRLMPILVDPFMQVRDRVIQKSD